MNLYTFLFLFFISLSGYALEFEKEVVVESVIPACFIREDLALKAAIDKVASVVEKKCANYGSSMNKNIEINREADCRGFKILATYLCFN